VSLRVLIAVTHLLGAGHFTRAAALARAFARAGHVATLVSGGMPVPLVSLDGVRLVPLPPVRTRGTDFRTLLDADGQPVTPEALAERRETLLAAFREARPDVLITELFPFGRRVLADEFLALLDAARAATPRPLVAASIRDVLVAPKRQDRIAEAHARFARFYDLVLVHGDPHLVPLEASWPVDDAIRPALRYTGYVDEGAEVAPAPERGGVIVSGGSSAAAMPLYRTALEAAALVPEEPWRVLVGNGVPETDFESLRVAAPGHATVERARRDFRALLTRASASVSQCGYNTAVDLLRAGVPAVLVPFEAGQETEQRLRAECLRARGLAQVVPEAELSAPRLAAALRAALGQVRHAVRIDLDGAGRTVALVEEIVEGHARAAPVLAPSLPWRSLDEALARAADAGRVPAFWWRDDDAVAATPALDRLLAMARRCRAPVALAAIPARAEPSLRERLADEPLIQVLVHGLRHANHAPDLAKKAEFGPHRPLARLADDAARALEEAGARLGPGWLPVFVPPWNRVAPDLVPLLPRLGFCGLSAFKDRKAASPAPGLVQANAHLDPIDWHGGGSLRDPAHVVAELSRAILARLDGGADAAEPIGILTHHLVHDPAVWHFCESLADRLAGRAGLRYLFATEVFSANSR
jgi:predicted glycosyltransferase